MLPTHSLTLIASVLSVSHAVPLPPLQNSQKSDSSLTFIQPRQLDFQPTNLCGALELRPQDKPCGRRQLFGYLLVKKATNTKPTDTVVVVPKHTGPRITTDYQAAHCEHIMDLFIIKETFHQRNGLCSIFDALRAAFRDEKIEEHAPSIASFETLLLQGINREANSPAALAWLDEGAHTYKSKLMIFLYGHFHKGNMAKMMASGWPGKEDRRMQLFAKYMQFVEERGRRMAKKIDTLADQVPGETKKKLTDLMFNSSPENVQRYPDDLRKRVFKRFDDAVALVNKNALARAWDAEFNAKSWEVTKQRIGLPSPSGQQGIGSFFFRQGQSSASGSAPVPQNPVQSSKNPGALPGSSKPQLQPKRMPVEYVVGKGKRKRVRSSSSRKSSSETSSPETNKPKKE